MAATPRQQALDLKLRESISSRRGRNLNYFGLMRTIECARPDLPRLGSAMSPATESVRVRSSPALDFAPTALAEVVESDDGRFVIDERFLSLFGPNGALPIHLTEYAWDRLHNHRDSTIARFADIFHHRMLLAFYRAWAQANLTISYDREDDDDFSVQAGSVGGYGLETTKGRDAVPDNARLHYVGLFARHVRSAECGAQILSDYFGVPVEIEQLAVGWIRLPASQQTRLGIEGPASCLGIGTVAGANVPDCQSHYVVRVGPMSFDHFRNFLPGARAAITLADWLRHYFGDAFSWKAQIVLQRDEVPRPIIGVNMLLGWHFWLGQYSQERDADELNLFSAEGEGRQA